MHHLVRDGTLTVGITAKDPPLSFSRADGTLDGSRIMLFSRLAHDLGLSVNFVRLDWPAILPGLFANRFDMACEGVEWTPERLAAGGFLLSRPVAMTHLVVLVRGNDPITDWHALAGRKLGGVRGETEFARARKAVPEAIPVAMPGRQEGLMALLNGQVDAFVVDLPTARSLKAQASDPSSFRVLDPGVSSAPQGVCVNAREADLLQAVDILLTQYRTDGTLAQINARFGNADDLNDLAAVGY
jgi:ABC-type amino acid transport substrate-binding protein